MTLESTLFHHFAACLVVAAATLILGFFMLFKSEGRRTPFVYGLYTLGIAVWSGIGGLAFVQTDANLAQRLYQVNHLGVIWIAVFFLEFVESLKSEPGRSLTVKCAYLYGITFSALNILGYLIKDVKPRLHLNSLFEPNIPYGAMSVGWLVLITIALAKLIRLYLRSSAERKNQLGYFCVTTIFAYIGGAANFLTVAGFDVPYLVPFGMYAIPVYTFVAAYAILAKNLMDIRVAVKRTLVYAAFGSLISLIYVLIIFLVHQSLMSFTGNSAFSALPSLSALDFTSEVNDRNFLLNMAFTSYLLTTVTAVSLAALVLWKGIRRRLNQTYALYTLSIALWTGFVAFGITAGDSASAAMFWKIAHLGVTGIPAFFIHFVATLSEGRTRSTRIVIKVGYLYSIVFWIYGILGELVQVRPKYFYRYFGDADLIYTIYSVVWTALVCYALFDLFRTFRKSTSEKRNQLGYFSYSMLFAYIGGAANYLPIFDRAVPYLNPFGTFAIPLYMAVTGYAILAHRLLDIRIVIKRTFFYFSLAFLISLLYVVFVFLVQRFYLNHANAGILINIIVILVIACLIKPVEMALHRTLDKRFFKGSIDELSEQKELLRQELERRERMKSVGILASGMAHEIKNPITAISTFIEYLPSRYEDPEFRTQFNRIVPAEINRVKKIVQDLLDFSKPGPAIISPNNLNGIIQDTLSLLSRDFVTRGVETVFDAPITVNLSFDKDKLKQALLNIFMNAMEAMPNGGRLVVELASSDRSVQIKISDSGRGIPSEKIPHIFDPFFTDKDSGTGLGLAVTHSIIEQHKGQIAVSSAPGKGTCFVITLPI